HVGEPFAHFLAGLDPYYAEARACGRLGNHHDLSPFGRSNNDNHYHQGNLTHHAQHSGRPSQDLSHTLLFRAGRAIAPELQTMAAWLVAMRAVNRLLSLFDGLAVELDQRPAGDADKVVVVRVPVGVLEAPRPLIGTRSTGKPRVCEELNRAENRRLPTGGVIGGPGREKPFAGHVLPES